MGNLYVVATPIGNLGDISSNALEILSKVDIIACEDTRVSINLLRHYDIKTKLISYHKFNEKSKSLDLILNLQKGLNIALISDAGCPCISDPGSILVAECLKNNINVYAIPGASAVNTALMVSGFSLTSFAFYGFLERENKKMREQLNTIKKDSTSVFVIYESPKRILKTLTILSEELNNPEICLCNDLTKKFEKKYYGLTNEVIEELKLNVNYELGEYVIVVNKHDIKKNDSTNQLAIEALIVDEMVKNPTLTLKDVVKVVSEKYHYSKNIVYDASLNLKNFFNK